MDAWFAFALVMELVHFSCGHEDEGNVFFWRHAYGGFGGLVLLKVALPVRGPTRLGE